MEHEMREYVFLVDKSISMFGRESDVIRLLNRIFNGCEQGSECTYATLGLFSECLDIVYIHNEWQCVRPINQSLYYIEGGTALFDAVCEMCRRIEDNLKYIKENISKYVKIYVITDGIDNASVYNDSIMFKDEIEKRLNDGWKIDILTPEYKKIPIESLYRNI